MKNERNKNNRYLFDSFIKYCSLISYNERIINSLRIEINTLKKSFRHQNQNANMLINIKINECNQKISFFNKKNNEIKKSLSKVKSELLERMKEDHHQKIKKIEINKLLNNELKDTESIIKSIKNIKEINNLKFENNDKSDNKYYDLFICHASEDKEDFVRDLANSLISYGLKVWYDEISLSVGDSLRKSIDNGLIKSKYGVVVLSSNFFKKNWASYELNGLITNELCDNKKIILPIWHKVTIDEVRNYSPSLADRFALNTSLLGVNQIAKILFDAIKKQ